MHEEINNGHARGESRFLLGVQGAGGKDEVHAWRQGGEQQVLPVRALQMC